MDSEKVMKLIFRKDAFITAADLVNIMRECSYEMNDTNKSILDSLAFVYDGLELPLPSGRYGNAIALALEINNYVVAEYLIKNADRLNLDTDFVVSEPSGKSAWSLKDEYFYSQLTYEGIDDDNLDLCDDEYYQLERQELANERLKRIFSITKEDMNILKKVK